MVAFAVPILSLVFLAQSASDHRVAGTVVDEGGKAIAGAQVVLYAPPIGNFNGDAAEARGESGGDGRFDFKAPPLGRIGRISTNGVHVWAFKPGLTVAAVEYQIDKSHAIVLRKPEPRSLRIDGPDGKSVAGARVEARRIFFSGANDSVDIPGSLAAPLAITTGPDGTATFAFLRGRDRLFGARVAADAIGEQDVPVSEETREGSAPSSFVIKLKKTSRLSGRIVDPSGRGVAGQVVEIWSRTGQAIPNPVGFKNGPVRTGADGTFQTPTNLLIGSTYRVAVREPGKEPIISDFFPIGEEPVTIAPRELRSLRAVSGRVVDRQGKAVANVEVFQSGDGPKRTSVRTDASGRFALGGFQNGTVFLFARGEGFRFHGQMLKPGDREVTVELTRFGERPARNLTKLADPIPIEESRGMARRIMESWWKAAVAKGDESGKLFVVQFLMPVDAVGALQKIGLIKFPTEKSRARLQSMAARALARNDFEEGETVAESIADPGIRAGTLAHLADLVPGAEKQRKLGILERALIQAKATIAPSDFVYQVGEVAGRLYELGETAKAQELFAEALARAKQATDVSFKRRSFAALLARVDSPGAIEVAKLLADDGLYGSLIVSSVAFGLPWDKPAEADRFLALYPPDKEPTWLRPVIAWKIATLDPARAQKLVVTQRGDRNYIRHQFCVALGVKGRDEPIMQAAIQAGLRELDRALDEEPEMLLLYGGPGLAIVEAIDPGLVPEVMWRLVAGRPASGNPRVVVAYSPAPVVESIAWYDRELAGALLEPTLARMDKVSDAELMGWSLEFGAWTLVDPRATVARLERVPMTSTNPNDNRLWIYVVEMLSLDRDERWRRSFIDWAPIFNPNVRDWMPDRF
jgi:Carboxypeptidase regulatory-like domain